MKNYRERMIEASRLTMDSRKDMVYKIKKLYENAAEDMARKAASRDEGTLTYKFCKGLSRNLKEASKELWSEIENGTVQKMHDAARIGVSVQTGFLREAANAANIAAEAKIRAAFTSVNNKAVEFVLGGKFYSGKTATLSKRIWNNEAIQNGKIEELIASALAQKQDARTLAKSLESYLNPYIVQPDNWNDLYPDIPFVHKVDYNAKRLAVTAINHAFYGATLMAARENPFADFLQWELTDAHVIVDVCDAYAEHDEGLGIGRWPIEAAPVPHPFCTCLWYVDTDKSLEEIGKELNEWVYHRTDNRSLDVFFTDWEKQNKTSKISVKIPKTYNVSKHKKEIEYAKWFVENMGGDIELLEESKTPGEKTPDYLWKGEYWELKTVSTVKAIDSALRKANKQLNGRKGGILLDCEFDYYDAKSAEQAVENRMRRGYKQNTKIILIWKKKIMKIIIYDK